MKENLYIHNEKCIEIFLQDLKSQVCHSDFSGVGIIFYNDIINLKMISLGGESKYPFDLPICDYKKVLDSLATISQFSSEWHDGFHLYDLGSNCLTHISQYISPDVDLFINNNALKPLGARKMSGIIASLTIGISYVGLLTKNQLSIYKNGKIVKEITYEL